MMTGVGVILGTAAYMSPGAGEGAAGGQAQRHLGVRLRALRDAHGQARRSTGEDSRDTLADVLQRDPDWALSAGDRRRRHPRASPKAVSGRIANIASATFRRRCTC